MFECQFTSEKPPYSFSCLIALAIDRSPAQRLPVHEIYTWIQDNFLYFKPEKQNWKVFRAHVWRGESVLHAEFDPPQPVAEQVF